MSIEIGICQAETFLQPPVDKKPWNGIFDGSKDGPSCIQLQQFNESQIVGSEDCLVLNVYTPDVPMDQTESKLKPVLVTTF